MDIFDDEGNLVHQINESIEGVAGQTSGEIPLSVSIDTLVPGDYTFELYIMDTDSLESNILSGDFIVS